MTSRYVGSELGAGRRGGRVGLEVWGREGDAGEGVLGWLSVVFRAAGAWGPCDEAGFVHGLVGIGVAPFYGAGRKVTAIAGAARVQQLGRAVSARKPCPGDLGSDSWGQEALAPSGGCPRRLAGSQATAGQVHGDQRRRARRVDGQARPA